MVTDVHAGAGPLFAVVEERYQVSEQKGEENVDAAGRRRRFCVVVPRLRRDRPKASVEAGHQREYANDDAMHKSEDAGAVVGSVGRLYQLARCNQIAEAEEGHSGTPPWAHTSPQLQPGVRHS